eukprot:179886-Alexandrium_andersonii.AAC.1
MRASDSLPKAEVAQRSTINRLGCSVQDEVRAGEADARVVGVVLGCILRLVCVPGNLLRADDVLAVDEIN